LVYQCAIHVPDDCGWGRECFNFGHRASILSYFFLVGQYDGTLKCSFPYFGL